MARYAFCMEKSRPRYSNTLIHLDEPSQTGRVLADWLEAGQGRRAHMLREWLTTARLYPKSVVIPTMTGTDSLSETLRSVHFLPHLLDAQALPTMAALFGHEPERVAQLTAAHQADIAQWHRQLRTQVATATDPKKALAALGLFAGYRELSEVIEATYQPERDPNLKLSLTSFTGKIRTRLGEARLEPEYLERLRATLAQKLEKAIESGQRPQADKQALAAMTDCFIARQPEFRAHYYDQQSQTVGAGRA